MIIRIRLYFERQVFRTWVLDHFTPFHLRLLSRAPSEQKPPGLRRDPISSVTIHAAWLFLWTSHNLDVDVFGKFSEHLASFHFPLGIEETHIGIIVAEPNFFGPCLEIQ